MKCEEFLKKIRLEVDNWDDYGYKQTMRFYYEDNLKFYVKAEPNDEENISRIHRGVGEIENSNFKTIFWGGSPDYYKFIKSKLPDTNESEKWYKLTGDIAYRNEEFLNKYNATKEIYEKESRENEALEFDSNELVEFKDFMNMIDNSFFREQYDWSDLLNQCHRLTIGEEFLSNYKFNIKNKRQELLKVDVKPKDNIIVNLNDIELNESELPFIISNNIFCLIGKNGSGKTTFLKDLAKAFAKCESRLTIVDGIFDTQEDVNVIKKIIYISFSPFDERIIFENDEMDPEYIGVQNYLGTTGINNAIDNELMELLKKIKNHSDQSRRRLWREMLSRVSFESWSDKIMGIYRDDFDFGVEYSDEMQENKASSFIYTDEEESKKKISQLSSGQKIFILVLTNLALKISQRTVVLMDEPELFLHPPMIKAYIRLLADLVSYYNGLAFVTTHSPITIQEIPDTCVKIATRDLEGNYKLDSVAMKTFGESINTINDSIFNIGLQQTGYYKIIDILKTNSKTEDLEKIKRIAGSEGSLLLRI